MKIIFLGKEKMKFGYKTLVLAIFSLIITLHASSSITMAERFYVDAQPTEGDLIRFTFVIENTGDELLHDVKINEPLLQINDLKLNDLVVGERIVIDYQDMQKLNYTITHDDLLRGNIKAQAQVTALDSNNQKISYLSDNIEYQKNQPSIIKIYQENPAHANIGFIKTLDFITKEYIYYKYLIKNIGEFPLYDIHVEDWDLGIEETLLPISRLDVNQSITYTYKQLPKLKVKLTNEDISKGVVVSRPARITATSYGGNTITWLGDFSDPSSYLANQNTIIYLPYLGDLSFLSALYQLILF